MTNIEIEQKLCDIVVELGAVDYHKVQRSARFVDIGLDSIDMVDLVLAVEEDFALDPIPEDTEFKTFGELCDYVEAHS